MAVLLGLVARIMIRSQLPYLLLGGGSSGKSCEEVRISDQFRAILMGHIGCLTGQFLCPPNQQFGRSTRIGNVWLDCPQFGSEI